MNKSCEGGQPEVIAHACRLELLPGLPVTRPETRRVADNDQLLLWPSYARSKSAAGTWRNRLRGDFRVSQVHGNRTLSLAKKTSKIFVAL
jgi:hypothetical protein